jgi:hypothetical protein
MKTTREVLEERDSSEYSIYISKKALLAREIAKRIEYFLPYWYRATEESDTLGWIFNQEVKYSE